MRHRLTLQDTGMLIGALLVSAYVLLEVDVFVVEGVKPAAESIEADELPILGMVLSVGLLLFAWRRMRAQKQEATARMEAQAKLRDMAFQDALTGSPNRRCLIERLSMAVASPPAAGTVHAVMVIDLNGFKRINDVFGHGAGDQALVTTAQRVLSAIRDGDMVARIGGDEFVIVAMQLPSSESATGLALRVLEALGKPTMIAGVEQRLSAGIGICLLPFDGATPDETLRRADVALYKAKTTGQSTLRFFDDALDKQVRERDELEREFRRALAACEIQPFFQPIVDLETSKIIGFEALARWRHATLGEIPPERFVAVAEDIGLITTLSDQLLSMSCKAALTWPEHVRLSFNLSPVELRDINRGQSLLDLIAKNGLSPKRLEVEITESALVRDMNAARCVLGTLRDAGISIALDDFGTGYSSLYHLRNFKLDRIKIDRSFVQSMQKERESAEIVAALVGLGTGLGLAVTAEGIEGTTEEDRLRDLGCAQGQGFLFSRAVSAAETNQMFADEVDHRCA
ncbi:putative bifunctional diguanylate cyclase/phosphodiesterase [Caballeronia grimmiae]|uniref:Diguanylate cyclase n=2 Tax=Caballeronia grimmiae TaxID=1071679 RepID=A0ABQ1RJS8_9BURK|nr:EAL domain-containing protein [Caballeronia grimmiae]GGD70250.1 hypothetical protein GCM10010985_25920 [Caballeronia grimmiae]